MNTAERDRRETSARLTATRGAPKEVHAGVQADIRRVILRHPCDPYLPLAAAISTERAGGNALPWIRGSIERDPMSGRPYLFMAFVFAEHGVVGQALLGIRMAVERDPNIAKAASKLALAVTRDAELLVGAAPQGPAGAAFLSYAGLAVHSGADSELRTSLLEAALVKDAGAALPARVRVNDLLEALEGGLPPCADGGRAACRDRAERLVVDARRAAANYEWATLGRARLLIQDGKPDEAERLLSGQCSEFGASSVDCSRVGFMAAARLGNAERMDQAAIVHLGIACSAPKPCERAALWLGDQFGALGLWGTALRMYERGARESGTPAAWRRVAQAASRAGIVSVAQRALQRVQQSGEKVDAKLVQDIERARRERLNQFAPP